MCLIIKNIGTALLLSLVWHKVTIIRNRALLVIICLWKSWAKFSHWTAVKIYTRWLTEKSVNSVQNITLLTVWSYDLAGAAAKLVCRLFLSQTLLDVCTEKCFPNQFLSHQQILFFFFKEKKFSSAWSNIIIFDFVEFIGIFVCRIWFQNTFINTDFSTVSSLIVNKRNGVKIKVIFEISSNICHKMADSD